MSETEGRVAETGAFRQAIENIAAGVVILQDERIVHANAHAARMLGREAGALIGADPAVLLGDDERGRPARTFQALLSGATDEAYDEYRIARPDGRVCHLASSCTRTEWAGRPAMLCVLHDISRQRAAMAALRCSEERYRTMIESLSEGVMIFDAQARLKGLNPAAERLLGGGFEELRRNSLDDWRPVDTAGQPVPPERFPISIVL